jgi:hypothetical protein
MDGAHFDAWTRRRFGLAAGGLATSLWSALTLEDGAAKKKHKKKRCKKLGDGCKPGGKRKCCGELRCDVTGYGGQAPPVCCEKLGKPCDVDRDCCEGLACCGGPSVCSTQCASDRDLKTNFGSVDPADMLARVRALPVTTWNYTSDDPAIRHIGPMAQDFAALFGVGTDDRHIHLLDGQGVALAAIQGLLTEVEELRRETNRLAARAAALEEGGS